MYFKLLPLHTSGTSVRLRVTPVRSSAMMMLAEGACLLFSSMHYIYIHLHLHTMTESHACWAIAALMLRVQKSRVQNLEHTHAILANVSWCPSVPQGKWMYSTLNQTTTVSFQILSRSLFTNHPTIRCHIWYTMTALLNTRINGVYLRNKDQQDALLSQ